MRAFIGRLAHAEPGFDVNHAGQSSDTDKAFCVSATKFHSDRFACSRRSFFPEGVAPVSTFFASDERGGLRIATVCAVAAVAAALDSILTAFAVAPASV